MQASTRWLLSCCAALLSIQSVSAQIINTIAGGLDDTIANSAITMVPQDFRVGADGKFYVVDWQRSVLYRSSSSGMMARQAGIYFREYNTNNNTPARSTGLNSPNGIVVDKSGNVFIADQSNNCVRKIDTNGIITFVAGSGIGGYNGDNIPAIAATLNGPASLALDSAGNLFITDVSNFRVRKVTPAGIITTVAGVGPDYNNPITFYGDGGPATAARLYWMGGLTIDKGGNLYIADAGNNRIRKVNPAGIITTVAGNGVSGYSGDGGPATAASLKNPINICVDTLGNLYIADMYNQRVRKVAAAGMITTIAGNGNGDFSGDGGPAVNATLRNPYSIMENNGEIYITDRGNYRIRKINTAGIITTVLGNGNGDGGPAKNALLNNPLWIFPDHNGGMLICDLALIDTSYAIRRIDAQGTITTIAGSGRMGFSGDGGPATAAKLGGPFGAAIDTSGNIYVADRNNYRIRKIDANGIISTFAGTGVPGSGGDGGVATAATIQNPLGVATDRRGNVYVVDYYNNKIRKVSAAGIISTVVGGFPSGYGGDGGPATAAQINSPNSVAVDSKGNIYVDELWGYRIRKIDTMGIITTFAGNGTAGYSGDGGPATAAQLIHPRAVMVDAQDNVIITDDYTAVRKVDTAGIITTIAGTGIGGYIGDGGPATQARINASCAAPGDDGSLMITESYSRVRLVCPATPAIPGMSITVSPGNTVPAGTPVTFTAHPANAGYLPALQWTKNGTHVGANSTIYTDPAPADGDLVSCRLTFHIPCLADSVVNSNHIRLSVQPTAIGGFPATGGILVFPNPTSGEVHVSGLAQHTIPEVFDLTGRKQLIPVVQKQDYCSLDLTSLAAGVYLLKAQPLAGHELRCIKLIKSH